MGKIKGPLGQTVQPDSDFGSGQTPRRAQVRTGPTLEPRGLRLLSARSPNFISCLVWIGGLGPWFLWRESA